MKRILLTVALIASFPASAKSPESVGRIFADVTACRFQGEYTKAEKTAIDLLVTEKYKVEDRGGFWKRRMVDGMNEEFDRLKTIEPLEKVLICSIIKNKWL